MTIDTTTAGLFLAVLGYAVTLTIWLSRLGARVEHLEKFRDDHSEIRQQVASLQQALHDITGWMQRLDGRFDLLTRNQHAAE